MPISEGSLGQRQSWPVTFVLISEFDPLGNDIPLSDSNDSEDSYKGPTKPSQPSEDQSQTNETVSSGGASHRSSVSTQKPSAFNSVCQSLYSGASSALSSVAQSIYSSLSRSTIDSTDSSLDNPILMGDSGKSVSFGSTTYHDSPPEPSAPPSSGYTAPLCSNASPSDASTPRQLSAGPPYPTGGSSFLSMPPWPSSLPRYEPSGLSQTCGFTSQVPEPSMPTSASSSDDEEHLAALRVLSEASKGTTVSITTCTKKGRKITITRKPDTS